MASDDPAIPDVTAGELALGVLEGEERAAALRRVLADPAFAREVEDWRGRLAGMFDDYPEVEAPESVAARLIAPGAKPPRRWPLVAALTALAASLLLVFVLRPAPPVAKPHDMMVASLMMTDKSASVGAMIDMNTGEVRIPKVDMAPKGKSAQLWMIGADGVAHPMGIVAQTETTRLTLPMADRKQLAAGVMLAVSVEPLGGSPTGKPTGPVVASGALSAA
ncbi:MAG: anti-sigma factor [Pseudomonadota bacterium]